ncbi:hypothetical protein H0A36_17295 [Endozoicomonas sp. SM1973]|uniref:Glutaredoxin domain-containing protein n=1 Tax=Spartinivicinus marinus TaxID=2994442 RepID=A0A853ICW8_9GAMM|nr:glutaredoxin domain-containing protein [Spartinivicinus marinus]MCX4029152.1 hypothetical protein [Spartinivicinus marinus]NYZ67771.1 hypothetical protein [Spartinivicinus marinus]
MGKFLLVFIVLVAAFFALKPGSAPFTAREVNPTCDIIMFSTSWCPVCKSAGEYLDRKNYKYCEVDIEKDSVAYDYYKRLGTQGVPTILIGDQVTVGLNPREIEKYMDKL